MTWYETNKERVKQEKKDYYRNNKEKIKERVRKYYKNNKDKVKKYLKKNEDRIKIRRKEYLEKNRERIRDTQKIWYNKNIKRVWALQTIRHHRQRNIEITFSPGQLLEKIRHISVCQLCGGILDWDKKGRMNLNSPTLDRRDNECILTLENIQILCNQCNVSKGSRSMKEFIDYCRLILKKNSEGLLN